MAKSIMRKANLKTVHDEILKALEHPNVYGVFWTIDIYIDGGELPAAAGNKPLVKYGFSCDNGFAEKGFESVADLLNSLREELADHMREMVEGGYNLETKEFER